MSIDSIASIAITSFGYFVGNTPSSNFATGDQSSLAGYIRAWVTRGPAVVDCQGSYENYLVAVIAIINRWQHDPSILDYDPADSKKPQRIKRRVEHIFPPGSSGMDWILDPHFFAAHAFATLHPGHDTWWKDDLR